MLHKVLTGEKKSAIVYNPAALVSGMSANNRRRVAHKETINPKALSSLTAPKEAFQSGHQRMPFRQTVNSGPQPLRDRRHPPETASPQTRKCNTNCRLSKHAHTKCYMTEHVPVQQLVSALQDYLRD